MLEELFKYRKVLARHREAPFLDERERYLQHCADQGMAQSTLGHVANEMLAIIRFLDMPRTKREIVPEQIEAAATRWARYQRRRRHSRGLKWPHDRFVWVCNDWLQFLGRLQLPSPAKMAGDKWIDQYVAFLRKERGLSTATISAVRFHVGKFFRQLSAQRRNFHDASIFDVDKFVDALGKQGWCRVSIATSAATLRGFFRYAEAQRWCKSGIAAGITAPHVYRDEGIPVGPDWSDVEYLIADAGGNGAADIRDKALLQLMAIYGLRAGEIARLRLEDLNWRQDRIHVTRPKQRRSQEYPLVSCVGESILRYLERARPKSAYREVFLTLKAPIQPLSPSGMTYMVATRLHALNIHSLRYGPHALRHACATRLVAQGFSLKEIGDHLGHRSAYSTRTYAKVDLTGLRAVAEFSLGGLL
jgi:integrase/recombinase XerD